jgi:hypothetical protein
MHKINLVTLKDVFEIVNTRWGSWNPQKWL